MEPKIPLSQILIRRLNALDQDLLIYVGRKTFDDTFRGTCSEEDMLFSLDQFYNTPQVKSELADEEDFFWGAFYENELVGFYRMHVGSKKCPIDFLSNERPIELKRIYLLEKVQGLGIGQLLMDHAQDFARSNKRNFLYLSVWEYNFKAQKFYQKNRFEDSGYKNDFPLGNTPQTDLWYYKPI